MASRRIEQILSHLQTNENAHGSVTNALETSKQQQNTNKSNNQSSSVEERSTTEPQLQRDDADQKSETSLHWNGWGYRDTEFIINDRGLVQLTGSRYLFSGKELPELRKWMEDNVGIDIADRVSSNATPKNVPPLIQNEAFLNDIKSHCKKMSTSDHDRVFHAHGHTCQEIYALRFGSFPRVPDVVVWPGSHDHCVAIVAAAKKHNVVIVPYGGGTNVTDALICPENEKRMIVSLDMHEMNAVKWINHKSMLACIEAGVVGKALEQKLNRYGMTLGHEPDSSEFSTLGGWVATRASGMKKNKYGNIEDIVVSIKIVTPTGVLEKSVQAPRLSSGPDLHHLVMGSEGIFGIVTEVILRIRPVPKVRKYGSIAFPDFESGVSCLHEVAMKRVQPASIRLVDNLQFQFSQVLKPAINEWKDQMMAKIKKWYVLKHRGFDANKMVAATLLFEGTADEVREQERQVYEIGAKYGGLKAGEENGIRGYFLTYMIAYLRDFGFNFKFIAESFETSVPWDHVLPLCYNVKERIHRAAAARGVAIKPFVTCRVTQVYDTGACVYFYFGFMWKNLNDPVRVFSEVEHEAREEILRNKGSISHHHGVGKLRKQYFPTAVSDTGVAILRDIKKSIDPTNIFAINNLFDLNASSSQTSSH